MDRPSERTTRWIESAAYSALKGVGVAASSRSVGCMPPAVFPQLLCIHILYLLFRFFLSLSLFFLVSQKFSWHFMLIYDVFFSSSSGFCACRFLINFWTPPKTGEAQAIALPSLSPLSVHYDNKPFLIFAVHCR